MKRCGPTLIVIVIALGARPVAGDTTQSPPVQAPPPPHPVDLIGAVPSAGDIPAFVGSGGQIYGPTGEGSWRRDHLGGVATTLHTAVRMGDDILGAGDSAPLYRLSEGVWSSEAIPARGQVVLADDGNALALAIANRVYVHDGDRWVKRARTHDPITALWAASKQRIYIATDSGLASARGKTTRPIRCPTDCTHVRELAGVAGHDLYAITTDGRILAVTASRAREVAGTGDLTGFSPTTAHAIGKRVLFAGVIARDDQNQGVLVAAKGTSLATMATLGPLAAGDDPVAIAAMPEGILVATRGGQIFAVVGSQATLRGHIDDAPPAPPALDPGKAPAALQAASRRVETPPVSK